MKSFLNEVDELEKENEKLEEEIKKGESDIQEEAQKPKRKARTPFKAKPCTYCDVQCNDRIGLAKHLISDHWETVRTAQGGGKVDRSYYYKQIQDSRIIRPQPTKMSARTSFHMKGLAGAAAANQMYQNNRNGNNSLQKN